MDDIDDKRAYRKGAKLAAEHWVKHKAAAYATTILLTWQELLDMHDSIDFAWGYENTKKELFWRDAMQLWNQQN